ncbi:fluoride efflux transporter CrcB [Thalassoroseus pseudoceratinae]|uniref:fluoride efflux transporter CrcB n=1 Tax=Thalassoroseus pseudoceratinae TaxID=2713176 RepID=UPI00141F1CB5|nr:fluoride efflux transporter CrcB [Thalassoroseus pseudoceratinae]
MTSPILQMLTVGLGGFFGAIARFTLTGLARRWVPSFPPIGTLAVNVLGCFLIGALMAWVIDIPRTTDRQPLPELARMLLVTGMLGSLTTFSAFGYEAVELMRESRWQLAFAYVAGNLFIGLGAVVGGRLLACRIWG